MKDRTTRGDISLSPEFTFRNPEQIAVLEIMVRNRNEVFHGEHALILYSSQDPSLVTVAIDSPILGVPDTYYYNNCQPENLLILDHARFTKEEVLKDEGDYFVRTTVKIHNPTYKIAIEDKVESSAYGEGVNREC